MRVPKIMETAERELIASFVDTITGDGLADRGDGGEG
jgi:hypothetical protein